MEGGGGLADDELTFEFFSEEIVIGFTIVDGKCLCFVGDTEFGEIVERGEMTKLTLF